MESSESVPTAKQNDPDLERRMREAFVGPPHLWRTYQDKYGWNDSLCLFARCDVCYARVEFSLSATQVYFEIRSKNNYQKIAEDGLRKVMEVTNEREPCTGKRPGR